MMNMWILLIVSFCQTLLFHSPATAQDPELCRHVAPEKCTETYIQESCQELCSIPDPEFCRHVAPEKCTETYIQESCQELCSIPAPDERQSVIPTEEDGCGLGLSSNIEQGISQITEPHEFPWLASLGEMKDGRFRSFCGGTLITKQHVITAAHCFLRSTDTIVRLGEYNTQTDGDSAKDFKIVDKRSFGSYNISTKENDIILLKLDRLLNSFTDEIRAACLPYHLKNHRFDGDSLVAVGWGLSEQSNPDPSPIPLKGTVAVVPLQECQETYGNRKSDGVIDDRQLCTGHGGAATCNGNGGGPINYFDSSKGRFYVVGQISWGPHCSGAKKTPEVNTRIGFFVDWIEENIKDMLKDIY